MVKFMIVDILLEGVLEIYLFLLLITNEIKVLE